LAKIGGAYMNSQLIKMEAVMNGYSEGIALDENGYIGEGSGENLFLVVDGIIYTPGLHNSILGGITRKSVIQLASDAGYTVIETNIMREMVYMADEMFFTGTAAEITPIRSVDKTLVGKGMPGKITKQMQEAFFDVVSNGNDKYSWLRFVDSEKKIINLESVKAS
jgi:branched-chain amino acid aminotransferase